MKLARTPGCWVRNLHRLQVAGFEIFADCRFRVRNIRRLQVPGLETFADYRILGSKPSPTTGSWVRNLRRLQVPGFETFADYRILGSKPALPDHNYVKFTTAKSEISPLICFFSELIVEKAQEFSLSSESPPGNGTVAQD